MCVFHVRETNENGEFVVATRRLYCDQLLTQDNKQDGISVLCVLEAFLFQLKREMKTIKRLVLQSDNAKNYHSKFMRLMIPIVSHRSRIRIVRYIHTESGDGKSSLDAHFSHASSHVNSYVSDRNDAATALEVTLALGSHGGLPGTLTQLLSLKRQRLEEVEIGIAYTKNVFANTTLELYFDFKDNCEDAESLCDVRVRKRQKQDKGKDKDNDDDDDEDIGSDNKNSDGENDEPSANDGAVGIPSAEEAYKAYADRIGHTPDVVFHSDYADAVMLTDTKINLYINMTQALRNIRYWKKQDGIHDITQSGENAEDARDDSSDRDESQEESDEDENGKGDKEIKQLDILSYALEKALEFCNNTSNENDFDIRNSHSEMPEYQLARDYILPQDCIPGAGWTERPKAGTSWGEFNMEDFQDDIAEIFNLGEIDSSIKQHPAWIHETRALKYQYCFDIPTEQKIQQEIGQFIWLKKKRTAEKLKSQKVPKKAKKLGNGASKK